MLSDEAVDIVALEKNRATSLIEEFMVAANGVVARTLRGCEAWPPSAASCARPSAGTASWNWPKAWAQRCPPSPIRRRSTTFCSAQKQKDPDHFPDLSLAVVKLMGPGEYVLVKPNEPSPGHFGLAVQDYTHSTAPNRRFPDMVTQRVLKALARQSSRSPTPKTSSMPSRSAARRWKTQARKVEREMQKRIAAVCCTRTSARAIAPSSPA